MGRYRAYYDGYDLSRYCHINTPRKSLMAPVFNEYRGLEHVNGSHLKYSSLGQIVVELDIVIREDTQWNIDQLNKIIYSKENKRLVLGDQPDRYLMCKLDGEMLVDHRRTVTTATLRFVSPDYCWYSFDGAKMNRFDRSGGAWVKNEGTANAFPLFNFRFNSDCGYFGLVFPEGSMTFGNINQEDFITLPSQETAMDEEMHELNTWTKTTNIKAYGNIVDENLHDKYVLSEAPKFNQYGTILPKSSAKTGVWRGHMYVRDFNSGTLGAGAQNFTLHSRVDFDVTSSRNESLDFRIAVLDRANNPIMMSRLYNGGTANRNLQVSHVIRSSKGGWHRLTHKEIPLIHGSIWMEKNGNQLTFRTVNTREVKYNSSSTNASNLKVGQTVHIKPSCTYIYDANGRRLTLNPIIKGIPLKIGHIRSAPAGRYRLDNPRGYVEGWFNADAIQEASATITNNTVARGTEEVFTRQYVGSDLAGVEAYKVVFL